MKAIILAAGEGKRLRPLTDETPKCLLPINGQPLLYHWLIACEKHKITEVLINGHYLSYKVESFIRSVRKKFSVKIKYVYEKKLLGTGGTVKNNYNFVKDEDFFLLCHGDNFTDINLSDFIQFHQSKKSKLTVALFKTNIPEQCGIVEEINDNNKIVKFVEKPSKPKSNIANAAIFLMSPSIIKQFPNYDVIDFSKQILPIFQGEMYGYFIEGFNIDIGTIDNYNYAQKIASKMEQI